MRRSIPRALFLPIAVLALVARATPPSVSAGPLEAVVPKAEGLVLDGKSLDAGWEGAVAIPAEAVDGKTPTVRVLLCGGKLWFLAEMPEDVGFTVGLRVLLCADGTTSAADAMQAAYGPQEVRGPRYALRGPRGIGRTTYRFEGAADLASLGRWSVEASIPVEDLALPTDTTPIRAAIVVMTRQLNRFATAPVGSSFQAPPTFAKLSPPAGGWSSSGKAVVDADRLAKEDLADATRMTAWREFVEVQRSGAVQASEARTKLLGPLDRVLAARPDLAMAWVVRGNILQELQDVEGARAAYAAALAAVPHMPEAAWALAAFDIAKFSEGPDTMPSDYPAAFARIAAETKARGGPAIALEAAEGALRYRVGEFDAAIRLLEPVVKGYPVDDELASKLTFSKKYGPLWAQELGMREADAKKDSLPRVRFVTSRGAAVVELFEDDAPNTVKNFVWLVRHGFYDGLLFHRVIPYFMTQGGDPFSATGDRRVGQGDPGYKIRTEPSRRLPFRGMIAMANSGKDTEGSQFFITTGTSAHLEGSYSIFGRVIEGQDVVDSIVRGDKIVKVEIVRAREHEYRPTTLAGTPAPDPVKPN